MSELKESTTEICEESIQCAQKQRSESLKIESEYEHYVTGDRAIQIDSDSPAPHVSSEWLLTPRSHGRNQMPSNSTSKVEKYGFSKSVLMGRKLFTESSEYGLSHGKRRPYNMSPEVEFIRERTNSVDAMSPEVEYLGQRRRAVTNSPEVEFLGQSSKRDVSMSPDVECLGEICFNNVCNNMSDAIDDLYNAGLSLGYRSVSSGSGKENRAPKRVITRITYLCSPFEINNTSRIEPNDIKLYETITTLCDDPIYGDYWVVNMNNYRVTLKQLGCSMKQDGWVEAWVINAYCRKLFKDLHPRKSQKHYFFHTTAEYFLEKWPNEYMRKIWHDNVVKGFQGADSARKLHLSKRLHFPSLYDRHWFLFSVDLKARKFLFMDSLLGESSRLHKEVDERMIKNFTQTRDECKLKDMHFETFDKMYPKLPKQKTLNDCGVFLIKFMELFCTRNPQSCSFSTKDITEFRLEIAINTLFNEHNSAHNYMEFIKTFDIEAYRRNQISQQ